MFHYVDHRQTGKGDSLVGYQVALRDPVTNTVIPIFGDAAGTPIVTYSGIANVALTDANGNVSLYVPNGSYNVLLSDPLGNVLLTTPNVPMGAVTLTDIYSLFAGLPDVSNGATMPLSGYYWNGGGLFRVQ